MNDKLSDNAPDNTNSNVNSVDVNNSNDIPVPIWIVNSVDVNNSNDIPVPIWIVNTIALYAILYFRQMNKTNTHVNFVQDQTKFRENA